MTKTEKERERKGKKQRVKPRFGVGTLVSPLRGSTH